MYVGPLNLSQTYKIHICNCFIHVHNFVFTMANLMLFIFGKGIWPDSFPKVTVIILQWTFPSSIKVVQVYFALAEYGPGFELWKLKAKSSKL